MNIFDDFDAYLNMWKQENTALKQQIQQKDIKINQLTEELAKAKQKEVAKAD